MAVYTYSAKEHVEKLFSKLKKKNFKQLLAIRKKLIQILKDPYKFKPLGTPMQGMREVHLGSFVLIYSIDESKKLIIIEDYAHHDKIYRN